MDVKKIATLACLTLSTEEEARLAQQMEEIVAFAAILPVTEGDGTENALTVEALREDRVAESMLRHDLLSSSKISADGCVSIPRIGRKEGNA